MEPFAPSLRAHDTLRSGFKRGEFAHGWPRESRGLVRGSYRHEASLIGSASCRVVFIGISVPSPFGGGGGSISITSSPRALPR